MTTANKLREIFYFFLNSKPKPEVKKGSDPNALKLLFICSQNLRRSKTAEDMYISKFNVKSAGLWCGNTIKTKEVTLEMLQWADRIFVFDQIHIDEIRQRFKTDNQKIINLNIQDNYHRGHPELKKLIGQKMTQFL